MEITKAKQQFDYMLDFTKSYQKTEDKYLREAYALKMQTSHILMDMDADDLIVGRAEHGFVGFSPQFGGLYTYYFHENEAQEAFEQYKDQLSNACEIAEAISFWKQENTLQKLNERFAQKHSDLERYKPISGNIGRNVRFGGGSSPTGRLALTMPDLDKLIRLGIPGLRRELNQKNQNNTFIQSLQIALDTISDAAAFYEAQVRDHRKECPGKESLQILASALQAIRERAPKTFIEGLQLMWLYSVISDLANYGRMDVYLGDLYVADLEKGILDEETAIAYLTDLYRHFSYYHRIHDTRIIVGGKGRRNENNADRLAMVIMEVSRRVKDVVPQLTLRYYSGMKEEIFDKALQVNAEGCSFPLLYSDDTNIPAVMEAYGVSEKEAETYLPAGCGEYVLDTLSVGTPNSAISMLKCLELALHNGRDCYHNKAAGPDSGNIEDFSSFEDVWHAFEVQVQHELPIVAWAQKECYNLIEENAGMLHLSLLMNDCVEREKPLMEGGVRYLNGATEIMGLISAADSLTAIKKLVYDEKRMSLKQLVDILDANFKGYERERQMMKQCPKYGNDHDEADAMAMRLFDYISYESIKYTEVIDINRYHMVNVNNSESAVWGQYTMASACGRKAGDAMSNGNSPSIGGDTNGITALFRSMSKFNHNIHAGVINNVRFAKELFQENFEKMKILIQTFFETNGSQLNLMVIGRDDLVNAKKHPEQYQNLIIRIGGFSAKFVELDPVVQDELINRTTYCA